MLTLIAAAVLSSTTAIQSESATTNLGEVWLRYWNAPTLDGTIKTSIYENDRLISTIETHVSYDRSGIGSLYIHQVYSSLSNTTGSKEKYLITGDGRYISYNMPSGTYNYEAHRDRRLTEEVSGEFMTLGGQYSMIVRSLKDRSVPLDLAIARREDLGNFIETWGKMRKVEGGSWEEGVTVLVGPYSAYPGTEMIGEFQMVIGPENDLLHFETLEKWSFEGQTVNVRTKHEVDLKVGASVPPERFKVIR